MPAEARFEDPTPDPDRTLGARAGMLLERLRAASMRVHAITNEAAAVLTANLLLAAGVTPSLTSAPDEVAAFAARADALLVNLGTLDERRRAAIPPAMAAARAVGRAIVLDPVLVEASPARLAFARDCLAAGPTILRLNAGEFAALAGEAPSPAALLAFARAESVVVALTGAVDRVSDGRRLFRVANGHPLMARVTAMGCAASALVAAFAALSPEDPAEAAAAALAVVGVAGEVAGETARGPGSFPVAFLDALHALDSGTLRERVAS